MLAHFFEVRERRTVLFHERAHASKGSSFELLAPVQTAAIMEKPDAVF